MAPRTRKLTTLDMVPTALESITTPAVRSTATMAEEKPKFQSEIELPNGAKISCKKPTNGVRRALLEQPETNLRFIIEIIAAACITKMVLPAGYSDNDEETVLEFTEDGVKDVWNRLDNLDLLDTQAYIEVFQECNIPSPEMIKQLLDAAKAGKK